MKDRGASEPDTRYLLGHTPTELARLDLQGELYRSITEEAFAEAGIQAGMSVLDIGCGTGDVSLLAATAVGPAGKVLGIDRGEKALAVARAHAAERELHHVGFLATEIGDFDTDRAFDALVGRFVLMHQPDPASLLRSAARAVRPGGVVVLIESFMDMVKAGVHSVPHSPLYHSVVEWKKAVVRGAGADLRAGARLEEIFVEAGLPEPTSRLHTRMEGGQDSPYYRYVAESVSSMLPQARRLGLAGFGEDDVGRLEGRLRDEVVASGGSLMVWPVVAAWVRLRVPATGAGERAGSSR